MGENTRTSRGGGFAFAPTRLLKLLPLLICLSPAVALAQTPAIFVLDEPINHLDPQHQLQVLKLLRRKADEGCGVIMTLHDPNLALQFADHALLLFGDGRWRHGKIDVIDVNSMTELYRTPMSMAHSLLFHL